MALLTEIIPKQNFELVRDQIGAIIALELASQVLLNTAESKLLNAKVFVERTTKIDHTEMPVVNVLFDNGTENSNDTDTQDGTHVYNIDFYANSKTNQNNKGGALSRKNVQRLMGVVRSILHSPHYRTLGIPAPSIMNRTIRTLQVGETEDNQDSRNSTHSRIVLEVRFAETTEQFKTIPLAGSDTSIKLDETEKGFQYILNST